jgi:hypothetical protein
VVSVLAVAAYVITTIIAVLNFNRDTRSKGKSEGTERANNKAIHKLKI